MAELKVLGPGFIAITVSDVARSGEFYQKYLGLIRDPFAFGPGAVAHFGWPAYSLVEARPGQRGPAPDTTSISLWWRSSDAQALFEQAKKDGVQIVREPVDGPFGRTFTMADPDGYRVTVYEKDQPQFWPPKG